MNWWESLVSKMSLFLRLSTLFNWKSSLYFSQRKQVQNLKREKTNKRTKGRTQEKTKQIKK